MRVITIAALAVLAGASQGQADVESDYPMITVRSARFAGPPDAQGLFTMYVTISAASSPHIAAGSFEVPVSGVHGPGEALAKDEEIVPKLRADLEKDKLFCPK